MRNWPWRSVVLIVAGAFIATVILVPDPSPQDLSSLSASELVALLDSPRQMVRQAAAGQLIARGRTVGPDLVLAAVLASPGQLREIMAILTELLLSSDLQVAEAAETALEQIAESENKSAAIKAGRVLHKNTTLRHTRALDQIARLGGTVTMVLGNESLSDFAPGRDDPMALATTRAFPTSRIVLLDRTWQGGDAGLRYVRRVGLPAGDPLSVHVSDDAPISDDALKQLQTQREKTLVRRPSQGCMGVIYSEAANDLRINGVIPNSPADLAGLRFGDWISSVDGESIERFAEAANRARERRPGDTLELTVHRGAEVFQIKLTLGSDFATGVCRCVE